MTTKEERKNKENKIHLLFICTLNVQRSPTAEYLFYKNNNVEAYSAGIHMLAVKRVRQYMIDWADEIFVMNEKEDGHLSYLRKYFNIEGKKIYDLNIPDIYERDDPELINILKEELEKYF